MATKTRRSLAELVTRYDSAKAAEDDFCARNSGRFEDVVALSRERHGRDPKPMRDLVTARDALADAIRDTGKLAVVVGDRIVIDRDALEAVLLGGEDHVAILPAERFSIEPTDAP